MIVGARSGCRPGTFAALLQRHRAELVEDPVALVGRQLVAVNLVGVVGVEVLGDRRQ